MAQNYIEDFDLIIVENREAIEDLFNRWHLTDAPLTAEILANAIIGFGDEFLSDLFYTINPQFQLSNFEGDEDKLRAMESAESENSAWDNFFEWGKEAAKEILKTGSTILVDRIVNGKKVQVPVDIEKEKDKEKDNSTTYLMWGLGIVVILILAVVIITSSNNKPKF